MDLCKDPAVSMPAREALTRYCREKAQDYKSEIDNAYWTFSRCARGALVPGNLYTIRNLYTRISRRWSLRELR